MAEEMKKEMKEEIKEAAEERKEEMKQEKEEAPKEEKKTYLPTRLSLFIRIAVGAYLFYTVYSLRDVTQKYTGGELIFFLVVMALFTVIGLFLCIHSGRALMLGKYVGGVMDEQEKEKNE